MRARVEGVHGKTHKRSVRKGVHRKCAEEVWKIHRWMHTLIHNQMQALAAAASKEYNEIIARKEQKEEEACRQAAALAEGMKRREEQKRQYTVSCMQPGHTDRMRVTEFIPAGVPGSTRPAPQTPVKITPQATIPPGAPIKVTHEPDGTRIMSVEIQCPPTPPPVQPQQAPMEPNATAVIAAFQNMGPVKSIDAVARMMSELCEVKAENATLRTHILIIRDALRRLICTVDANGGSACMDMNMRYLAFGEGVLPSGCNPNTPFRAPQ